MTTDERLLSGASSESSLPPNKSSGDIVERLPRVSRLLTQSPGCAGTTDAVRAWMVESAAEIERLRREVEQWAAQSLKEDDCRKSWQARALAAESSLSEAVKAEREACAKVAEAKAVEFLSPEYATGQPFSSFNERFACEQVATAIRSRAAVLEQK